MKYHPEQVSQTSCFMRYSKKLIFFEKLGFSKKKTFLGYNTKSMTLIRSGCMQGSETDIGHSLSIIFYSRQL